MPAIFLRTIMCMILALGFSVPSAFAIKHHYDPALLEDMYRNPENYILLGGGGTGLSFYLDKNSINVHEYNPPYYIIAFKKVSFYVYPSLNGTGEWLKGAEADIERYYYDFYNKKMYLERKYLSPVEKTEWEYIDLKAFNETSGSRSMFTGGEIAFYLAYNMNFYDPPYSHYMQEYLKRGYWINFRNED